MDCGLSTGTHVPSDGLRERNVASPSDLNVNSGIPTVTPESNGKDKAGKTFGRTPDGTGMQLFTAPSFLETCQLDKLLSLLPCKHLERLKKLTIAVFSVHRASNP
jgi:phosphatidylethanolamine N-methyltransferase